jgi:GT2 family glycosyltransferase
MKTICAVIVTCNPDRVLIDTVNSVLSQVDHIVIVDNSENPWDEDVTIALP